MMPAQRFRELDNPEVLETLAQNTLIIYITRPPVLEQTIIERAKTDPKPLYYREVFLMKNSLNSCG